jgi:Predicted dithiol-disulfide isomerase involved in polyketide biosynthesis
MNMIDVASLQKVKLKVEIWSDVVCPWCYIGKRRFEQALEQFEHKQDIEIVWKSYQLDPELKSDPKTTVHQMLANKKGISVEQARQMNDHVTQLAHEAGLSYHFERAVVANTFDAHRLIQLAKKKGLGPEAEERLFRAYFTEGENLADHATLEKIGSEIGIPAQEVSEMLSGRAFADEVSQDAYEAYQLGIRSVPTFVFNERYGIAGAQEPDLFLSTLRKAWNG